MPTAELEGTTCSDAQNEKHSRRRDCLNCEGLHAVIATQRLLPRPRTLETLGCLGLIYFSTPFICRHLNFGMPREVSFADGTNMECCSLPGSSLDFTKFFDSFQPLEIALDALL